MAITKIRCSCINPRPSVYIKGNKYNIVKCSRCKLLYADTKVDTRKIEEMYRTDKSFKKIRDSQIEKDDCTRRLEQIEKIREKKGKILDFGTGDSNFLYIARSRGWDVYGFELNEQISKVHKRNGIKMLAREDIKDNSFDAITLFHVFEHIAEPDDLLEFLHKKLKKGGLLVIDVPNGNALEIKLFREKSAYVDMKDKAHLYYYSMKTLKRILKKHNFSVVKKRYKGGFAIGQFAMLKKKVTGNKHVEGIYTKAKPLAKMYKSICQFLRISDCIQVIAKK